MHCVHKTVKGTHTVLSKYGMVNVQLHIYYYRLYTSVNTLFQDRSGLRIRSRMHCVHKTIKGTHAVLSHYGMVNVQLLIYYHRLCTV